GLNPPPNGVIPSRFARPFLHLRGASGGRLPGDPQAACRRELRRRLLHPHPPLPARRRRRDSFSWRGTHISWPEGAQRRVSPRLSLSTQDRRLAARGNASPLLRAPS